MTSDLRRARHRHRPAPRIAARAHGSAARIAADGPPEQVLRDPEVIRNVIGRVTCDARTGRGQREHRRHLGAARASRTTIDAGATVGHRRSQRRRQDDAAAADHGHSSRRGPGRSAAPATTSPRVPAHGRSRLGIGYAPEDRVLFPTFTVEENLRLPCEVHRRLAPRAIVARRDDGARHRPGTQADAAHVRPRRSPAARARWRRWAGR